MTATLDALPDLDPLPDTLGELADVRVGGAVQALRGVMAGGTPAQALRAAELVCRLWLAGERKEKTKSEPGASAPGFSRRATRIRGL